MEDIPSIHPFGSPAAVRPATARGFAYSPFDELAFLEDEEVTLPVRSLCRLAIRPGSKT
jgi:hypothetical protein